MTEKKPRKPYKPPAVRTEKLYERAALACGKVSPNPRQTFCRGQRRLPGYSS